MKVRDIYGVFIIAALFGLSPSAYAIDGNVMVFEKRNGVEVRLIAKMSECTDATVTLNVTLQNMSCSQALPLTIDLSGKKDTVLATLKPVDAKSRYSYRWQMNWKPGHRLSVPPKEYLYRLPYEEGIHTVIQGPQGPFSHGAGTSDEQAIDFAMPIGTRVCAARAGTVTAIRSDCSEGGPDPKYKPDFNYVIIRHEDGTYAEYVHLQQDGVLVRIGEKVAAGSAIGISGNTGYTTQPHLHFAVFYTTDGYSRVTLPVRFKVGKRTDIRPQIGDEL